jgi:hypothetical protein
MTHNQRDTMSSKKGETGRTDRLLEPESATIVSIVKGRSTDKDHYL